MIGLDRASFINHAINAIGWGVKQDLFYFLFIPSVFSLSRAPIFPICRRLLARLGRIYFFLGLNGFSLLFGLSHRKHFIILVVVLCLLGLLGVVWFAFFGAGLVQFPALELYVNVLLQLVLKLFQVLILFGLYFHSAFGHGGYFL